MISVQTSVGVGQAVGLSGSLFFLNILFFHMEIIWIHNDMLPIYREVRSIDSGRAGHRKVCKEVSGLEPGDEQSGRL